MPTVRSRSVDDTHPVARWLFEAADATAGGKSLKLLYDSHVLAKRAARSLRTFRDKGALAPPGTYEPSAVDPRGEGRGYFDHIEIRVRDTHVELGPREFAFPQPKEVTTC